MILVWVLNTLMSCAKAGMKLLPHKIPAISRFFIFTILSFYKDEARCS
jgi:hypothetical protein